jgi:hypothetical protein
MTTPHQVKETASGLHRQWQLLSVYPRQMDRHTSTQEQLQREALRLAYAPSSVTSINWPSRFPIECNGEVPQGWRWQSDAPVQSLPHMNSSQAVTL